MSQYYDETARAVAEEAECSKVWAQTDGRRASKAAAALRTASPPATLEEIAQRLDRLHGRLAVSINSAIEQLDAHADRLYGPVPETASGNSAKGLGRDGMPGAVGTLFSILDLLEVSSDTLLDRLHNSVARNTNLA